MKRGGGSMWKSGKQKNQGTSMVTVVISFVLLMLFVTSYLKVQRLSENMMMDSKDRILNNGQLIRSYYLGETEDHMLTKDERLHFTGKYGSFFVYGSLHEAQAEGLEGTIYYYGTETEEGREP